MLETLLLASVLMQDAVIEGNPRAAVRVVIYEDMQCPDCTALRTMMDIHLLPKYRDRVAFEHRDFPLPKHSWAKKAALAARHFDYVRPGSGIDFRRYILQRIRSTDTATLDEQVRDFARQEGLDPIDAMRAMGSPDLEAAVDKDYQDGVARGVSKVPTVYVGSKMFVERINRELLTAAIEKALAGDAPEPSAKQ